jgi:hypothetical protein
MYIDGKTTELRISVEEGNGGYTVLYARLFNTLALKIKSYRILHPSHQRLTIETTIFSTDFSSSVLVPEYAFEKVTE